MLGFEAIYRIFLRMRIVGFRQRLKLSLRLGTLDADQCKGLSGLGMYWLFCLGFQIVEAQTGRYEECCSASPSCDGHLAVVSPLETFFRSQDTKRAAHFRMAHFGEASTVCSMIHNFGIRHGLVSELDAKQQFKAAGGEIGTMRICKYLLGDTLL